MVLDELRKMPLAPGPGFGGLARTLMEQSLSAISGTWKRHWRHFPKLGGIRFSIPGDRAKLCSDGSIELLGRDSLVINSGGEKIFVEEIERVLLRHPQVVDAIVTSRPSDRWGQEVVALVQLLEGDSSTMEAVRDFASQWLAKYKLPKERNHRAGDSSNCSWKSRLFVGPRHRGAHFDELANPIRGRR